jgi:hypothetical protein
MKRLDRRATMRVFLYGLISASAPMSGAVAAITLDRKVTNVPESLVQKAEAVVVYSARRRRWVSRWNPVRRGSGWRWV